MIATTILSSLLLAGEAMPSYIVEVDAIVFSGDARTRAAAQQDLRRWTGGPVEGIATRFLHLREGYPKIVRSDKVEGMRPGFHAVVLGYCEPGPERDRVVSFLTALDPAIYVRRVRIVRTQEYHCPQFESTATGSRTPFLQTFRAAGARNALVVTMVRDDPTPGVPGIAVVSLRDPKGQELAASTIGLDDHCKPSDVAQPDPAHLVVRGECDMFCRVMAWSWSAGADDKLDIRDETGEELRTTDSCYEGDE